MNCAEEVAACRSLSATSSLISNSRVTEEIDSCRVYSGGPSEHVDENIASNYRAIDVREWRTSGCPSHPVLPARGRGWIPREMKGYASGGRIKTAAGGLSLLGFTRRRKRLINEERAWAPCTMRQLHRARRSARPRTHARTHEYATCVNARVHDAPDVNAHACTYGNAVWSQLRK